MPVLPEHYADSSFMAHFPAFSLKAAAELADILEALENLPEEEQLLLSLIFVEDLNLAEAALVLDMQAGEVFMMYLQATSRFTTNLGQLVSHPLIV